MSLTLSEMSKKSDEIVRKKTVFCRAPLRDKIFINKASRLFCASEVIIQRNC